MTELILHQLGVLLVSSVMVICGVLSKRDLIRPSLYRLFSLTGSPRLSLFIGLLTMGSMPIHGRMISISPLISPLSEDIEEKRKLGILSYLCTHHFYLWCPLEKSVLITMGFLQLSWLGFLGHIWIPLVVTLLFTLLVFLYYTKNLQIEIPEVDSEYKGGIDLLILFGVIGLCFFRIWPGYDLVLLLFLYSIYLIVKYRVTKEEILSHLKWFPIFLLALSVTLGWYFAPYEPMIRTSLGESSSVWVVGSLIFLGSLLLGSSAKYSGLCVVGVSVLGLPYLPLLYTLGYIGYLLSPAHQCVSLGKMYFGTTYRQYYTILSIWSLLLFLTVLIFG